MIDITDSCGRTHYIAASAIAQISEAGASSQWHGTYSIVRLFDGRVVEASEPTWKIIAKINRVKVLPPD